MAISYVGEVKVPATDNTTNQGTTVTFTPPSMTTGDFVLVYVATYLGSQSWSVTTTGGQTWTEVFDTTHTGTHALYWCVYDGTWDANPVFTRTGASANDIMGWMVVLSGVDPSTPWDVDPSTRIAADTNDQDFTTFDTTTNGAWAVWGGFEIDNNTCATNNGGAWASEATTDVGWRVSTLLCMAWCRKYVASLGATGATTLNYSANDAGGKWSGALKAYAATVVESGQVLVQSTASPDVLAQRDLLRSALIESTADAVATRQLDKLRVAEVESTADAQVTATYFHVLERSAEVGSTADAVVQATYFHVLDRLAEIESTADIVVERQIVSGYSTLERAVEIESTAELTVAGVAWSKFKVLNLVATPISSSRIDLEWDDVTALSGETYDIERNGTVIQENWASLTYSDTGLDPETEYTYRVRAAGGTPT